MALFEITWILLRNGGLEAYLQGHTEEFSVHLVDEIAQTRSQLDAKSEASPMEMPGSEPIQLLRIVDPVGPEEITRILQTVKCHHL